MNAPGTNWRNLIGACAAISIFGIAFGMTYPLLSLILESRGVSSQIIGLNAAMMPLGILIFSSVIPRASKKLGSRNLALCASVATALLIIAYLVFPSLAAWFFIRLLQGMSISTLFVLSEAWIVGNANDGNRGKVVAIYASVLSLSFSAGPLIVGWTGIEGTLPFWVGTIVVLVGILPLLFIQEVPSVAPDTHATGGVLAFFPKAPMLLSCVGAFAILDAATLALLPVYALRLGLDIGTSVKVLAALIIGNVVLQFPIGMLADRYPRRQVLMYCALLTSILLLALPSTMGSIWMWPVLIIGGAAAYGVYTVSLSSLGDRFSGQELIDGTSAFAGMWGIGALLGALLGGWAMAVFGPHGLPVGLALIYGMLVAGLLVRIVSVR